MKLYALLAIFTGSTLLAQTLDEPVVLTVEIENAVIYRGTVFDASRIARDPGPTTSVNQAFIDAINIGDIVAVNGKPVKGMWSSTVYATPFRSTPQPGQVIADFDLAGTNFCTWQLYDTDGTFLGMIRDSGAGQGHTLVGGLAGFFGAIGTHQGGATITPTRQASTGEDPANRRNLGGGKFTTVFYLYPRVRPTVEVTATGPSIFRQDGSLITSTNPARPGEVLTLRATGLGPVKPNLEPPGAIRFSSSPLQEVQAAVTVEFNGKELPALNKVGWPGSTSVYRLDFQLPSDTADGQATLQLIATWIRGPVVNVPVNAR